MRRILSKSMAVTLRPNHHFSEIAKFQNNFLSTTNLAYIESLYSKWLVDKASVSPSFSAYFELLQRGTDPHEAYEHPAAATNLGALSAATKEIANQLKMRLMIDTYRTIGHQFAKIDPLDLGQNKDLHGRLPEDSLAATQFGYRKEEMNESIIVRNLREEGPEKDNGPYTIQAFEDYLRNIYCDKIGFEYMPLLSKEERDFIKRELEEKIESLQKT
jgi:2-oxoglutarate dehydrogenase E1 component